MALRRIDPTGYNELTFKTTFLFKAFYRALTFDVECGGRLDAVNDDSVIRGVVNRQSVKIKSVGAV